MSKDVRLWEKDDETLVGLKPKFKMRCIMCRPPPWMFWAKAPELVVKMGYVFAFSLKSYEERQKMKLEVKDERDSFAMDVWSICPRCSMSYVNGVPLKDGEYRPRFGMVEETMRREGRVKEDEKVL